MTLIAAATPASSPWTVTTSQQSQTFGWTGSYPVAGRIVFHFTRRDLTLAHPLVLAAPAWSIAGDPVARGSPDLGVDSFGIGYASMATATAPLAANLQYSSSGPSPVNVELVVQAGDIWRVPNDLPSLIAHRYACGPEAALPPPPAPPEVRRWLGFGPNGTLPRAWRGRAPLHAPAPAGADWAQVPAVLALRGSGAQPSGSVPRPRAFRWGGRWWSRLYRALPGFANSLQPLPLWWAWPEGAPPHETELWALHADHRVYQRAPFSTAWGVTLGFSSSDSGPPAPPTGATAVAWLQVRGYALAGSPSSHERWIVPWGNYGPTGPSDAWLITTPAQHLGALSGYDSGSGRYWRVDAWLLPPITAPTGLATTASPPSWLRPLPELGNEVVSIYPSSQPLAGSGFFTPPGTELSVGLVGPSYPAQHAPDARPTAQPVHAYSAPAQTPRWPYWAGGWTNGATELPMVLLRRVSDPWGSTAPNWQAWIAPP